MITGDHRVTALAIARELDIYREGSTVISGDELETMTEEELDRAVQTAAVFARVSPADKLRIIRSLKRTAGFKTRRVRDGDDRGRRKRFAGLKGGGYRRSDGD